jgi:hypothetical protein
MEKTSLKIVVAFHPKALMDPDLRFYSHVLALSFNEKRKSFNLMVFILQFKSL